MSPPLTFGKGNLNLFSSPFLEILSINGPAGYPSPSFLPHLSKASPIASSRVSPKIFISK